MNSPQPTPRRITGKDARKMATAFLSLPLHRKLEVAACVPGKQPSALLTDVELAKDVFRRATEADRVPELFVVITGDQPTVLTSIPEEPATIEELIPSLRESIDASNAAPAEQVPQWAKDVCEELHKKLAHVDELAALDTCNYFARIIARYAPQPPAVGEVTDSAMLDYLDSVSIDEAVEIMGSQSAHKLPTVRDAIRAAMRSEKEGAS